MHKRVFVETDLHSYESFFVHEWAREVYELAHGTAFQSAVFELAYTWKSTANAHRLPWLVPVVTKKAYDPVLQGHREELIRLLRAFQTGLVRRMRCTLEPGQLVALDLAAGETIGELKKELASLDGLSLEELWASLIRESEMQLSIVLGQRLCYAALYYGYEDFLVSAFKSVTGRNEYRLRRNAFADDLIHRFGQEVCEYCWKCDEVNIAGLIRDAIAHNGCRVTRNLKPYEDRLHVLEDVIQITPTDNCALFQALKARVSYFLRKCLATH